MAAVFFYQPLFSSVIITAVSAPLTFPSSTPSNESQSILKHSDFVNGCSSKKKRVQENLTFVSNKNVQRKLESERKVFEKYCFGFFQDTPLHIAAENGDLQMVKFLVENKSDISVKNSSQVAEF